MKYILSLSSLIFMITITSDIQCMLTRCMPQRTRLVMLQQQRRFYNAGHPDYPQDHATLWNKINSLEQHIKFLRKDFVALEKQQTDTRSDVQRLKFDMRRHHHDENDDSYIPEHNMHYGNKSHE